MRYAGVTKLNCCNHGDAYGGLRQPICYFGEPICYFGVSIAVPIQMRYKIILQDVGARHCRALTGVPHVNENRYITQYGSVSAKNLSGLTKIMHYKSWKY
ncbi:MAG: hypothetical protein KME55_08175 [Nostoc indistinguendum CM1-VF10]|nr:hypothetical protein [Nostoc indistinguendum CM1-VF10]